MSRPLITLTTDFGAADTYVAQMKGVIFSICPDVQIVDVTHAIPPQDIRHASRVLRDVIDAFPPGTIHLAVVDPGVGSEREAIGMEASGHRFVGPNNGLFSHIFRRGNVGRIHQMTESNFRRAIVSNTFHGRDLFAPAAAHWAAGVDLGAFGPPLLQDRFVLLAESHPRREGTTVIGEIESIDSFGNLITNIGPADLPQGDHASLTVEIGPNRIRGLRRFYAEVPAGELLALFGSSSQLEIALNGGNASQSLPARIGAPVRISLN